MSGEEGLRTGIRTLEAKNRPGTVEKAWIRYQNKFALTFSKVDKTFEQFKDDYQYQTQIRTYKSQLKKHGGNPNSLHEERVALAKKLQAQAQALTQKAEAEQKIARSQAFIAKIKQEKIAKLQALLAKTDDPERQTKIIMMIANLSV
jgi:hypothetical protein